MGYKLMDVMKHLPQDIFIAMPLLKVWQTKAKEEVSPFKVTMTLLDTNQYSSVLGIKLS